MRVELRLATGSAAQSNLAAKVEAREAIQRTIGRTIADLEARVKDDLSRLRDDATNTCRALQVSPPPHVSP